MLFQENLLALTSGPQRAARYEYRKSIFLGVEIKQTVNIISNSAQFEEHFYLKVVRSVKKSLEILPFFCGL